jgi:N-glycosylase/DNA lyase
VIKYILGGNMITIKNTDINLKDTITCGQIFRYIKENDNSYTVILNDRVINIKKVNNDLIVKSNNYENLEKIVRNYLDLDRNYEILNKQIKENDNSLNDIIDFCKGFKIINQPKFECIISYIISANNGVPQIQNAVNNISKKYGKKVIFEDKEYFLFPTKEKLKNVTIDEYRNLKVGFRDKYIYEFVNKINNNEIDLNLIDNMSSEDAMKYLMNNKGIGEKVSSCILLFSYSRLDVFPIDTWVKKFMKEKYNIDGVENIKQFTKEKYNDYTGLVIQYIFHYNRNNK